jgi:hypothetical protein
MQISPRSLSLPRSPYVSPTHLLKDPALCSSSFRRISLDRIPPKISEETSVSSQSPFETPPPFASSLSPLPPTSSEESILKRKISPFSAAVPSSLWELGKRVWRGELSSAPATATSQCSSSVSVAPTPGPQKNFPSPQYHSFSTKSVIGKQRE